MIRLSIGAKLFFSSVLVFLFLLLMQWYLIRESFNDLYLESMMANFQSELAESIAEFGGGNELTSNQGLREYSSEAGAPVLAFTDNYEIADREFFTHFMNISIDSPSEGVVKILTASIVNSDNLPYFNRGRHLRVTAVPLGSSSFHEPITITFDNRIYVNKGGVRDYTGGVLPNILDAQGNVTRVRHVSPRDLQQESAEYIYENIKNMLILRLDIEPYLDDLCREVKTDAWGDKHQFLYEKKVTQGRSYYFVTERQVYFTGQEQSYINAFFRRIYAFLGAALILSALLLAAYISRPLVKLSEAARRLAALDFSAKVDTKRQDEVGRLYRDINTLSENLSRSMNELRETEEEALRREKRMQMLLTDLAHELRTPLGVISSNTEIFEKGLFNGREDYFELIYSEVDKLSSMVDEALDLARMQSGIWRVDIAQWNLADILNPSIKRLSGKLLESGFTLTSSLTEADVMADARRIDQVMANFLSNAHKYSDEKKRISIVTRPEEDFVRILVGNSGDLSQEERERIWQRYYSKTRKQASLIPSEGIGLDFIRTILDAHKSQYGVFVEDGMVWFYFTLKTVPPPPGEDE